MKAARSKAWPPLPLAEWRPTYATLHMWTQIVGKVRMALSPHMNHWWHVPLYVTSRGLTTSPIPYGDGIFEIQFDFIGHTLGIETSGGAARSIRLIPMTVAAFYREFMAALGSLGISVAIWPVPVEIPDPVRFDRDEAHGSYDPEYANRFWRILVSAHNIFTAFRSRFIGKASPVHFFWGSFDLAVTRFSGRRAPEREGADPITREAYSHEVISAGFWPGGGEVDGAAFYSYTVPQPPGLPEAAVRPGSAFYSPKLSEFLLRYEDLRLVDSPRRALLEFLQSTYEAGAGLAGWDRASLERRPPAPRAGADYTAASS
jgi:hypothetical protein